MLQKYEKATHVKQTVDKDAEQKEEGGERERERVFHADGAGAGHAYRGQG